MKVIKKEAVINFEIRTGAIQRIHNLSTFLLENRSADEIQAVMKAISENSITEPWMYHVETVVALIQQIEQQAEAQGCTTEVPDEDIIPEVPVE